MTAKEYLSRLRSLELRMSANVSEIESLQTLATHITSAINSDGVHTTGMTSDKLGNCVSRIVDLQHEISADTEQLEKVRQEIIDSLECMPDGKRKELLRLRYIGCMSFDEIAVEMDMTKRWAIKLHGRALQDFSQKNRKKLEKF